jgi:hypothetical protein
VVLEGARLTHTWRFDAGGLEALRVRKPGADLAFDVEVVDGAGHRAQATGSYQGERERYCAANPEAQTVCQ